MLEDRAAAQKVPVCIDGRLAASAATGVASYAGAMRAALTAVGRAPLLLDDAQRGRFGESATVVDTMRRQVRARSGRPVVLQRDGRRLHARDVFRLAQARFAATGRLLRLDAPAPGGIMHWTYPIPAWIHGWINLYTVHDAIPLTRPDLSVVDAAGLRRRIMAIAAVADRFVTVSATARAEILAAMPLSPDAVTDCGLAVAEVDSGDAALPDGLNRGSYFLFCGLAEPRKNLPRLIEGWGASGTRRPLVLVGPAFDGIAARPGLMVLPYQPRSALIGLLRGARALMFPSLAEGFGLPVAEAMAVGTPVLTSNSGALAETAGGAALLVDPLDTGAIAAGIARLDRDDALCNALAAAGRVRAQAFDLRLFGERLVALHAEFAGDSRLVD